MEEPNEPRWCCPRCQGAGTLRRLPREYMPRMPRTDVLHCEACDLYLEYYGRCLSCGERVLLTDQDVDEALDGRQLDCPKCQQPLDTARFKLGDAAIAQSGTLMPDLSPRLGLPNESDFITAARTLLVADPQARECLAVYHLSTSLKVRAASKHLQAIRDLGTPLGVVMYNYRPSTEPATPDADDREFDFEMHVFNFLMNARSALDILAHEINFTYRYAGAALGQDAFFDYRDAGEEGDVNLQSVKQKLEKICPSESITDFLNKEMQGKWFKYLTSLRDVSYHRRILIGPREGRYPLKKLWRLRPTAVEPEGVRLLLPDKPRLLWMQCTYDQKLELLETFTKAYASLLKLIEDVYGYLAQRMNQPGGSQERPWGDEGVMG